MNESSAFDMLSGMESVGARIKHLREVALGLTQEQFAKMVGVSRGAVGNWELDGGIKAENIRQVADKTGASVDWIANGRGKTPHSRNDLRKLRLVSGFDPDEQEGDSAPPSRDGIAELDLRAGLGPGGLAERHDVVQGNESDLLKEETWRFPPSFVRQELRRPESRLLVIETNGDSMEPTLRSGDRVIVDTDHRIPSPDGLYALRDRFGGTVVKRLQVMRRGDPPVIRVISDNASHSAEDVGADEIEIVGRVLFGLKKF